jgi:hypothetical protein
MPHPSHRITLLALAAIGCLTAMIAITLVSGVSQESFEIVRSPAVYAAGLAANPGALRALFGIDAAFLVLYATLFVVAGRALETSATRALVTLSIAMMLGTAVLDMIEDHHILAMLYGVESGSVPTAGQIAFQHTLSQVKFNVSYLGLFLLGLAMPRATLAGCALAVLLTVGTLVQGAVLYAAPVAMLPVGNFSRWLGFVAGFALLILVVRHRAAGEVATCAPA